MEIGQVLVIKIEAIQDVDLYNDVVLHWNKYKYSIIQALQ